jgi:hypothetical protein
LKQVSLLIAFALCYCYSSAQYIYYRDKRAKLITETEPVALSAPAPKPAPAREQPQVVSTAAEKPQKHTTDNAVQKEYKTYPDKCPGMAGAIPWCMSYVPELLIKILVDRYHGYLMTIKGIRQHDGSTRYRLQICDNGKMKEEWSLEDGTKVEM